MALHFCHRCYYVISHEALWSLQRVCRTVLSAQGSLRGCSQQFFQGKLSKRKSRIVAQEHKNISDLVLRTTRFFLKQIFLPSPVRSCLFVLNRWFCLSPPLSQGQQIASIIAFYLHTQPTQPLLPSWHFQRNPSANRCESKIPGGSPWGWVHQVTGNGGNCTAALMFPGEPLSGCQLDSFMEKNFPLPQISLGITFFGKSLPFSSQAVETLQP